MSPDAIELSMYMYSPESPETAALPHDEKVAEGYTRTELDIRQDDVLQLLDELNQRIEAVIREFSPGGAEGGPPHSPNSVRVDYDRRAPAA